MRGSVIGCCGDGRSRRVAPPCGAAIGGFALDHYGLLSPLMLSGGLMLLTALLVAAKVKVRA